MLQKVKVVKFFLLSAVLMMSASCAFNGATLSPAQTSVNSIDQSEDSSWKAYAVEFGPAPYNVCHTSMPLRPSVPQRMELAKLWAMVPVEEKARILLRQCAGKATQIVVSPPAGVASDSDGRIERDKFLAAVVSCMHTGGYKVDPKKMIVQSAEVSC